MIISLILASHQFDDCVDDWLMWSGSNPHAGQLRSQDVPAAVSRLLLHQHSQAQAIELQAALAQDAPGDVALSFQQAAK